MVLIEQRKVEVKDRSVFLAGLKSYVAAMLFDDGLGNIPSGGGLEPQFVPDFFHGRNQMIHIGIGMEG